MSGSMADGSVRILDVSFDPKVRTLCAAGRKTVLDVRTARLFVALSESFGDCVSKDSLMQTAWPGRLVHENSLAKGMSRLRAALAGSRIEVGVIYGVGYSLRETASTGDIAANQAAPVANRRGRIAPASMRWRRSPLGLASIAGVILVLIITGALVWRSTFMVPIRDTDPLTNDAPDAVATVLWVDDHPANNRLEVEYLRRRRIAVHLATTTEDALKLMAMNSYKLVISDLGRGEDRLAGLRMTQAMKARQTNVPVIIYTVRPKTAVGQLAQRKLIRDAGVADLALTPDEVRKVVTNRIYPVS